MTEQSSIFRSAILMILLQCSQVALLFGDLPTNQYLVEHLQLGEDIPFTLINDVHMSSDGYLWICNYNGLFRYDGQTFKKFDKHDSPNLRSGSLAVTEDAEGVLWIACNGRGIDQYQDGQFQHWSSGDGLDFSNYHHLYLDHRGQLMLLGKSGFQTIKNNDIVSYPISGLEELSILTLQFISDGTCYMICENSRVFKTEFKQDKFSKLEEIILSEQGVLRVSSVAEGPHQSLWLGTHHGDLYQLDSEGHLTTFPSEKTGIQSAVLRLRFDEDKTLWVVLKDGLVRMEQNAFEFYEIPLGTNAAVYGDVVFSHDGAVIVTGRDSGLFYFRVPKTGFLTQQHGLNGFFIQALFEDDDHIVWIATENGIQHFDGSHFRSYRDDLFGGKSVRDIFIDSQNRLWVCLLTDRLVCIDRERQTVWSADQEMGTSRFRTVAEDQNGTIWVGSETGVFSFSCEGLPHTYESQFLPKLTVLSLFVDRDNRLWVGTANDGLYRIEQGEVKKITTDNNDTNTIFAAHQDESGRMIYGSTDGILVIDSNDRRHYLAFDDLQDTIFSCIDDQQGSFWFSCIHSIKRVLKTDFYNCFSGQINDLDYELFDHSNALPVEDPKANARTIMDDDGRIWFPLKGGISIVDPNGIKRHECPPLVYIQSIEIDDSGQINLTPEMTDSIEIDPLNQSIRISYIGICHQTNGQLIYQIRLKGFDDWKLTNRIEAVYSNLSPRTYQFEVLARNADGKWSKDPVSVPIRILPAFYESILFQIVCVILFILLLILLYRYRVNYLKNRQFVLEKMVAERTRQLENVSGDLFESVSALTQANENKKQMLSMAAHDLKNAASGIVFSTDVLSDLCLKDDGETDKKLCGEMVDLISTSGNQILTTIKELLEKDEHEFAKDKLKLEERSMLNLIHSVVALNKSKAQAKKQYIEVISDTDGNCQFDPLQMRMAIDNYLSNAIKYAPFSSPILIQLAEVNHGSESCLKFSIIDEGPGLTEEDKLKVFRKYTKLSAKPTGGEHSSGIGLSIVKDILEAHSGWVGVDSESGKGACFYFLFPIKHIESSVSEA